MDALELGLHRAGGLVEGGDPGSLLVRLKVVVPAELSTQQAEALERYAALDGGSDPRAELFA